MTDVVDRRDELIRAGVELASQHDLDAMLQRIVELAIELTGARYAALGVIGPDGQLIDFVTTGVTPEQRAAIGDLPHGRGVLGLLIREAHPLRLRNIADHPSSVGFPPNHPPMHSFLGAPVSARGSVFGNIYLTEKQGAEEFDEADLETLVVLATQAGVAVENARLVEETRRAQQKLRELSVLEDRERIARELHDGVIQSLFAAGMSLQGAAGMADDAEVERRIENVVTDIDRTIRDLRNFIFGLRPGILADRQLDQALKELASEFGSRSGVVTVVEVDGEAASELSSRASDLVQLVREALSNVGRHGAATTCRVSLRRGGDGFLLEVDDDGRGFDVDLTSWGMGLTNLRDRVESLGGTLEIESVPGEGTTVRASIPS
jgi:signal transduction histidine kinase